MSRTYRCPAIMVECSIETHVKRERDRATRRRKFTKIRLDEAAVEARYQADLEDYNQRVKLARRRFWWYIKEGWGNDLDDYAYRNWRAMVGDQPIRRAHIISYQPVPMDLDKAEAEARADYATWSRDGRWGETNRCSGFKGDANETVRLANKQFCHRVLAGKDWENLPYPTRKLGKAHRWDWW